MDSEIIGHKELYYTMKIIFMYSCLSDNHGEKDSDWMYNQGVENNVATFKYMEPLLDHLTMVRLWMVTIV